MDVFEAIASRYSCRAFLSTAIPENTVRDIVERAARAPSAGNMQPWRVYVLAGKRVDALRALMAPRMASELPKDEGAVKQTESAEKLDISADKLDRLGRALTAEAVEVRGAVDTLATRTVHPDSE